MPARTTRAGEAHPRSAKSAYVSTSEVAGGALLARCAACGAGLARAPGLWKAGAAVAETTLGTPAYTAAVGATAPLRAAGAVVLREHFCPGCARLLETEVVLAGTPPEADVRPAFWAGA